MPPPLPPEAVLPERIEPVTVTKPTFEIPPPLPFAILPVTVLSVRLRVPALTMPPPASKLPLALPSSIVSPEIPTVVSPSMSNTRLWLAPLMASRFAPGPAMFTLDPISGSSVPPSVIVWAVANTEESNTIVSTEDVALVCTWLCCCVVNEL